MLNVSLPGDVQNERERARVVKNQIEEELRLLDDEISACELFFFPPLSFFFVHSHCSLSSMRALSEYMVLGWL